MPIRATCDALDIGLAAQTHVHTNISTYNKFCDMSKRKYGQVLVSPSRRLVPPAADDDFVILLTCTKSIFTNLYHLPPTFTKFYQFLLLLTNFYTAFKTFYHLSPTFIIFHQLLPTFILLLPLTINFVILMPLVKIFLDKIFHYLL